jgi:CRP/FNR family transcriptional regulator
MLEIEILDFIYKVNPYNYANLKAFVTQKELATSRVVISRLLKQLENDGKILLYRNEIKLMNEFIQNS